MKWFWKRNTNCDQFQAGLKKLQRDDIEGAINCWNQAIQLNPRHIEALLLRGDAKRRQMDYTGALSDLNRALAYEPQSTEAYFLRAKVSIDRSENVSALADLCKSLLHDPLFPNANGTVADAVSFSNDRISSELVDRATARYTGACAHFAGAGSCLLSPRRSRQRLERSQPCLAA